MPQTELSKIDVKLPASLAQIAAKLRTPSNRTQDVKMVSEVPILHVGQNTRPIAQSTEHPIFGTQYPQINKILIG
jgi:hypothetical protein